MESQFFIFDGVRSEEMNLHIMRIDHSGFVESPYWGSQDIQEEGRKGKLKSFHYGINKEPIEFTVKLVLMDRNNQPKKWTPQERFNVAKWLLHDTYKEFQTGDDLSKVYYVICTSNASLQLMSGEGYVELTFKTNSPYAWSPVQTSYYDLSSNASSSVVIMNNDSNVIKNYKPLIEIEMKGSTKVKIVNLDAPIGTKAFEFEELRANEIVSVDNDNRIVKSNSLTNLNPLEGFSRGWLELHYGTNRMEVTGKCKITIKSQFPIAQ